MTLEECHRSGSQVGLQWNLEQGLNRECELSLLESSPSEAKLLMRAALWQVVSYKDFSCK